MKLVCCSDWHGRLLDKKHFPDGDILIMAGDFELANAKEIDRLFDSIPIEKYKKVLFIPGNHDFAFRENTDLHSKSDIIVTLSGCKTHKTYKKGKIVILSNYETIEIDNILFQGFSWSPGDIQLSMTWAFTTYDIQFLKEAVNKLKKCDVLISHCPPYCSLDKSYSGDHIGLVALTERIYNDDFRYIISGHVHDHGGKTEQLNNTQIFNVATNSTRFGYENPKQMFTVLDIQDSNLLSAKFSLPDHQ